jgi:2-polyprenyl-3-methyl-5-hydroxy-6-metoxy-1,4-benzoquinol methylase
MSYKLKKNDLYGFLSVDPIPSKIELEEFYESIYYQEDKGQYSKNYTKEEIQYFYIDSQILHRIFDLNFPQSKRKALLDVGCGEGYQANYFYEKEWELDCVDYSEFGLNLHHPHLLKTLIKGDFETTINSLINKDKKYSAIFLKNVLEHVENPVETLKLLKLLMDEESLLFIDVPNDYSSFQSYLVDNEYSKNSWFCPPQHLHYFQFDSMTKLLELQEFKIVSMQSGFAIEQFLTNKYSNYVLNKSTGKEAHLSRCRISNYLISQGIDEYIKLRESFANLSFGRSICAIVKLEDLH